MTEINEKIIDSLKTTINDLLIRMGISGKIFTKITPGVKETISFNIKTLDANILIGQNGENLSAFQHLVRTLFRRKYGQSIPFYIDINNYRKDKERRLVNLARSKANQVKKTGQEVVLHPMPAYERRLIHLFLANEKQITTESKGKEPNRRVIIKPSA